MKKTKGLKRVRILFSSVFIFLLHLPFVFAKNRPANNSVAPVGTVPVMVTEPSAPAPSSFSFNRMIIYDSLRLGSLGLARQAFEYGLQGWTYLVETGRIINRNIISIIDFSKPSSEKRLFVIDLSHMKVLFNTYVAHGVNSGVNYANSFSNMPESNKSSLGFYQTANTYLGGHGYSMRLEGLERGINDNAARRDIVMHGAGYVNENYIHSQGYIGRSWGCPAVAEKLSRPIIDKIKNGTCLFIYSPQRNYLNSSRIINRS